MNEPEVLTTMDCGCQCVQFDDYDTTIRYCPMHSATEDLLDAAESAQDALNAFEDGCDCKGAGGCTQYDAMLQLRAAVAKAKEEPCAAV